MLYCAACYAGNSDGASAAATTNRGCSGQLQTAKFERVGVATVETKTNE